MKINSASLLLLALVCSPATAAEPPPPSTLPFVDEFDRAHDWAVESATWIGKFKDGRFIYENLNPNVGFLNWVARELPFTKGRDFEILTRVQMLEGAPTGVAMIVWDGAASDHRRYFQISADGKYGIDTQDKAGWTNHHVGVPSALIRKTGDNDLAIRVIGARVYYFINGAVVDVQDFAGPEGPWIGLVTPAGCTNSFDRLEVRYLPGTPEQHATEARKYEAEAKASLIAGGPPLEDFVEKFDDNSRNWPFYEQNEGRSSKIENGVLAWENRQKEGKQRTHIVRPINYAADYDVSFRARQVAGGSALISMIWNCNGNSTSGLEFGFTREGWYTAGAYDPVKYQDLAPWKQTTLVKPTEVNELRARKIDQTLFLFLNGQVVADVPAKNPQGDQLGFGISFGVNVAFDEIRVSYPKQTEQQTAAEKEKLIAALKANHGKEGLGVVYSGFKERDQISAQAKADMERLENERWKLTDADFKQLTKVRKQFEGKKMLSLLADWGRPRSMSEGNTAATRVYYNYKLVGRTQYYYEFHIIKPSGNPDQKTWIVNEVQHTDKTW